MYTPNSALEVEDLIYSVRCREDLVKRQLKEAQTKNQEEIADELARELGRLSIIRFSLENHANDHDYRSDRYGRLPEIFTD